MEQEGAVSIININPAETESSTPDLEQTQKNSEPVQEIPLVNQLDISSVYEQNKAEFQQNVRYIYSDKEITAEEKKQFVGEERISFTQNLVKEWLGKDLRDQVTVQDLIDGLKHIEGSRNYQEIVSFLLSKGSENPEKNINDLSMSLKESSKEIIQIVLKSAEENQIIPEQIIDLLAKKTGIEAEDLKLLQKTESSEDIEHIISNLAGKVDLGIVLAHIIKKRENELDQVRDNSGQVDGDNSSSQEPKEKLKGNILLALVKNKDAKGLFKSLDSGLAKALDDINLPHLLDLVFDNTRYIGTMGKRSNLEVDDETDEKKDKAKKTFKVIKDVIEGKPENLKIFYAHILEQPLSDGSSNSHKVKEKLTRIEQESDPEQRNKLLLEFKKKIFEGLSAVSPESIKGWRPEDIYFLDTTESLLINGARKTTGTPNPGE